MKISKRLTAVTRMAAPGSFAVDVGCDHGYTAIALVEKGICAGAVASDVREGPLRAALANVERANLSNRIRIVLADGIPKKPESYLPANVPALLIVTGMGGQLILRILRAAGTELLRFSELILGPQSEIPLVREQLPLLGFEIADEQMVEEEGKFYFLIKAACRPDDSVLPGGCRPDAPVLPGIRRPDSSVILSEAKDLRNEPSEQLCLAFGRPLLLRKDPVLARFLNWRLGILYKIEESLLSGGQGQTERMAEVLNEKQLIIEALEYVDPCGKT